MNSRRLLLGVLATLSLISRFSLAVEEGPPCGVDSNNNAPAEASSIKTILKYDEFLKKGCDFPLVDQHMGLADDSLTYWSKTSCDELFSPTPPPWLSCAKKKPAAWFPVCSLAWAQEFRRGANLLDPDRVFEIQRQVIGTLNDCYIETKSVPYGEKIATRQMKVAKPESQYTPTVLSNQARADIRKTFEKTVDDVTAICCKGQSDECVSRFKKIPLQWCEFKDGAWSPESCQGNFAYFDNGFIRVRRASSYIPILSPFMYKYSYSQEQPKVFFRPEMLDSGSWVEGFEVVSHELGHACSRLRQDLIREKKDLHISPVLQAELLSIRNGFDRQGKQKCDLSLARKELYAGLFKDFGAGQDVVDCVSDVIQNPRRYSNGAPCKVCQVDRFEEALAMWFSLITPRADKNESLRNEPPEIKLCGGVQDFTHPPAQPLLKCFLKNKHVQEMVKSDLNCK